MSHRTRRWWNIFGKLIDAIAEAVAERIPAESSLRSDVERMLEVLDNRADITAFAMARADEMLEKLKAELVNHDALGLQAEQFITDHDEEAAQRCVTLQLKSAQEITRLQNEYLRLQAEAENATAIFLEQKAKVDERVIALPLLQADARLIRAQEKIARDVEHLSLTSPQSSFDQTARELLVRRKQQENRQFLLSDPNVQLDRRIHDSLEQANIQKAMDALKRKMDRPGAVHAEYDVTPSDPVTSAQKLIEAPRYKGILPGPAQKKPEERGR